MTRERQCLFGRGSAMVVAALSFCSIVGPAVASHSPPVVGVTGYVKLSGEADELGHFRTTRTYWEVLRRAGALPVRLLPVSAEDVPVLLSRIDGLVLTGGPDIDPARYGEEPHPTVRKLVPEREAFDFALAEAAMARRMPILGICLGAQIINVARGGSLVQDIPSLVGEAVAHRPVETAQMRAGMHPIRLVSGGILSRLYGRRSIEVNSYHHQAVARLGRGLVVEARSPVDAVIEAFSDPHMPFLIGVQYHPEIQRTPEGLHCGLFSTFVAACVEAAATRSRSEGWRRRGMARRGQVHDGVHAGR